MGTATAPGLGILQELCASPLLTSYSNILPNETHSIPSLIRPNLSTIIGDLIHTKSGPQFTDTEMCSSTTITRQELLQSIILNTTAYKVKSQETRIYSAIVIGSTPQGLGRCEMGIPEQYQKNSIQVGKKNTDRWESSLCSPGAVTNIHLDYHGASQLMYHIHGAKLWLFWPSSSENMDLWAS